MKHGSLFSGIGGFDLAAEWMGWENKFHCEWNEFGQKVLHYYWPKAELFTDITKSDFTKYANTIDILTGGFPCQPYSSAGKRLGKEDERHLWPEMLRAISEIKPRWVVGENVFGITNWNGGLVFNEVQVDLEAQGYEVQPFILPAAGVQNAPHRRDRVWFVAYSRNSTNSGNNGALSRKTDFKNESRVELSTTSKQQIQLPVISDSLLKYSTDTEYKGLEGQHREWEGCSEHRKNKRIFIRSENKFNYRDWQNFPTVSPICDGDDGLSDRLDNITFSKWRNESIKAGGNAIVPQVVYQIFKTIEEYETIQQGLNH